MPKFTVVIPTLQRAEQLHHLVEQCANHSLVGEVLVVNNASQPLSWESAKVRVLQQAQNIGVNPAWNLGAREAKCEFLAILNDDIEVPDVLLRVAHATLRAPGVGIVGVHPSCYDRPPQKRDLPRVRPVYSRPWGFGTAMFMRRENYVPIPESLVIFYGDDWLFSRQRHRCWALTGISLESEHSTTSGAPQFVARGEDEHREFKRLQGDWSQPNRWERRLVLGVRKLVRREG